MESVKSTPKRSSTLQSIAAALLLLLAAALFSGGCAIEDTRYSSDSDSGSQQTAYGGANSWSKDDRSRPRKNVDPTHSTSADSNPFARAKTDPAASPPPDKPEAGK